MMIIDPKFEIGQSVFLKTDTDQKERLVYSYVVYGTHIIYRLACGSEGSDHYDFEISEEKKILV